MRGGDCPLGCLAGGQLVVASDGGASLVPAPAEWVPMTLEVLR
jgi:hypothetical protein